MPYTRCPINPPIAIIKGAGVPDSKNPVPIIGLNMLSFTNHGMKLNNAPFNHGAAGSFKEKAYA